MSDRLVARNLLAKHGGISRGEADRLIEPVPDDACKELADADPEAAKSMVQSFMEGRAQELLNAGIKQSSDKLDADADQQTGGTNDGEDNGGDSGGEGDGESSGDGATESDSEEASGETIPGFS